jgi:hypothetical protein
VVLPPRGVMNDHPVVAENTARDRRSCRLGSRVITMSTCPDQHSRFRRRRTEPSTGTARRHWAEGIDAAVHPCSSTFLRPFAPGPLQALPRSYGRSDSCSPHSSRPFPGGEGGRLREQVSLIHVPDLPALPSPTTCGSPGRPCTPSRRGPDWLPFRLRVGLRHWLAGSPHLAGRIEFVILRTGRSPPAAPHSASRRRSCRPVTVWRWIKLERTFTSLIRCASRRTSPRREPWVRETHPHPRPLSRPGARGGVPQSGTG